MLEMLSFLLRNDNPIQQGFDKLIVTLGAPQLEKVICLFTTAYDYL